MDVRAGTRLGYGLLVALVLLLAGCTSPSPTLPAGDAEPAPSRPVVVALIDTGVNPYHAAFAASAGAGAEQLAAEFGADVVQLNASGLYEERVEADRAFWEGVEEGKLYAFAGTRVMGIMFSHDPDEGFLLDAPAAVGHGTATASVVARDAPDVLIVMLQIDDAMCEDNDPPNHCPVFAKAAPALRWAAEQPWIDVVSVSLGAPGNPPAPRGVAADTEPYLEASRLAHENGKVLVNAAGNTVTPPFLYYRGGPPWVITVGGAQPAPRGDSIQGGHSPDVVANYTEWVASHTSVEDHRVLSGTSFAAPVVAATLAQALHHVRAARLALAEDGLLPTVAPSALRDALNASATLFQASDWDPTKPTSNDTLRQGAAALSLPIVFSPAQMGWGYVDAGLAPEIARRVLEEDFSIPPEKAQTAEYMAQYQALREEYWANAP